MSTQNRPKLDPKMKVHGRVIKTTTYCVAFLLAALMLTAALPPIVADQSDRAILNAPITLLTTPIAGEISAFSANVADKTSHGATIAEVKNTRVDRTTMIALESRVNNYRQAMTAAQRKGEADCGTPCRLDGQGARASPLPSPVQCQHSLLVPRSASRTVAP
jgi:hypothetical protein